MCCGYWSACDLIVKEGEAFRFPLGFHTPTWMHPTTLPDGWCVATQRDRVYLIDLKNHEICELAEGFGAMVVLRE